MSRGHKGTANKAWGGMSTQFTRGALTARNERRLARKGKHMNKVRWEGETLMIPKDEHKSYLQVINDALEALKNNPVPPEEGALIATPEGIVFKFTNGEWVHEEHQSDNGDSVLLGGDVRDC